MEKLLWVSACVQCSTASGRPLFLWATRGARNHSFLVGIQKHEKHNQQKPRWDRIWANEQPSIRLLSKKCPEPRLKHKEKTRIFFILDVLLVAPLQQTQMPRASIDAWVWFLDFMKAAEMGLHRVIKTKREIKSVFSFRNTRKIPPPHKILIGSNFAGKFTVHGFSLVYLRWMNETRLTVRTAFFRRAVDRKGV